MVGCFLPYMTESDEKAYQIGEAGYNDGSDDADVNSCLWLSGGLCLGVGGGCLLGSLGVVAAFFYEPSPPPPTRLLGKPPEYVDVYVSNYKHARWMLALSGASLGCATGAIAAGCLVTPWSAALGTVVGRMVDERGW